MKIKKVLLTLVLGVTALVLLAAVAFGILLATFNPNDYKEYFSKAVEKATGRQLVFHGDIAMTFFPTLGMKTGKLVLNDAGEFGSEPFLTVDGASVSVAVEPLFSGLLEVQEITLHGPVLKLATDAAGRHNWEYGFGKKKDTPPSSGDASGGTDASGGVSLAPPPAQPQEAASGKKGKDFVLHVEEISCKDATLVYRDLQKSQSYTGRIDDVTVSGVQLDADMPLALAGSLKDESSGRKVEFKLKSVIRVGADGSASVRIETLGLTAEGLAAVPVTLTVKVEARYAAESLDISSLEGKLSLPAGQGEGAKSFAADFKGKAQAQLAKNTTKVTGELHTSDLDLDALLLALSPQGQPAAKEVQGGAPNMSKPKVSGGAKSGQTAKSAADGATTKSGNPLTGLDVDLQITAEGLHVSGLPMRKVNARVRLEDSQAALPFSLEVYGGAVSGAVKADLRTVVPVLALNAKADKINMEAATKGLSGKYTITGQFGANANLTSKGSSSSDILANLKGKASAQAVSGEVRGFKLIPADLPSFKPVPEIFSYQRISASADIAQGVATSKDISLQSPVLTGRGGGTLYLPQSQADMGVDFMLGGLPPAVPVSIRGPFSSLSYGVDMRTFLRNVAESAVRSPETAIDLLKKPEAAKGLIKDIGGKLFKK